MKPYFEFYSDLDLILRDIESLRDKCHTWWMEDETFSEKEPDCAKWYILKDKLDEILDMLNDEPFFYDESE